MNIHEYQAKEILRRYGVATPTGKVAFTAEEAESAAKDLGTEVVVVKAQIHAGGRGKGGGVKLARSADEVRAIAEEMLGMQLVSKTTESELEGAPQWIWGVDQGRPGTLISYVERDAEKERRMRMGAGQTHHFALALPDEETQIEWREKIVAAGLRVSPVMNRVYFKSIYTSDPDGHIIELATLGPGFTVDESVDELGQSLRLPPWLEAQRDKIENSLRPISIRDE